MTKEGKIEFDEASIRGKLSSVFKSGSFQTNAKETVLKKMQAGKFTGGQSAHTPEEAAKKFIEVLKKTINASGLSNNAINAVSNIEYEPACLQPDGSYTVLVYFSGNLHRDSLYKEGCPKGIGDIVLLLNNGVDHVMQPVYGTWHGKKIRSRTVIPGAHFIDDAIADFNANYSREYGVIKIDANLDSN